MQDSLTSRSIKSDVAIGAGGAGGVLFQNIKPSIDYASSNVSSCFTKMISNIEIPRSNFKIIQSQKIRDILRIFELESEKNRK